MVRTAHFPNTFPPDMVHSGHRFVYNLRHIQTKQQDMLTPGHYMRTHYNTIGPDLNLLHMCTSHVLLGTLLVQRMVFHNYDSNRQLLNPGQTMDIQADNCHRLHHLNMYSPHIFPIVHLMLYHPQRYSYMNGSISGMAQTMPSFDIHHDGMYRRVWL